MSSGVDTDQLAARAELVTGEARRAEKVPERVEEQRVEERLGQLDVAEMAGAEARGLGAGFAAARDNRVSDRKKLYYDSRSRQPTMNK